MCETAYQLVRLLGGVHLLKKPVTAMSQGQLRLMLVARSLVREPEVLLLDEVTDGLDARARNTLLDALERASELSTLVMTTHRPETLPSWIGRQIVLENGKAVDGPMLETGGGTGKGTGSGCQCSGAKGHPGMFGPYRHQGRFGVYRSRARAVRHQLDHQSR